MFSLLEQCASEVDRGNITTLPWHHIGANISQELIQVSSVNVLKLETVQQVAIVCEASCHHIMST